MGTFLFDKIIFGPVKSRRLGVSLGINLLPADRKICSFDCIYCECGRTLKEKQRAELPPAELVREKLMEKLTEMAGRNQTPDVITFAGNGEPTLHPDFDRIIDDTLFLRDTLAPEARIAVLSNATLLHREKVFNALLKVDDNIQKIDSAFEETIRRIDIPHSNFRLEKVVENLVRFQGKVTIQTMFIRGSFNGLPVDNTTSEEVEKWIELLHIIRPGRVMIYTIERDTPVETLEKVPVQDLNRIAARVRNAGFEVQVSG